MSPLFIGLKYVSLKYVSLKYVSLKYVSLKDVMVPKGDLISFTPISNGPSTH